MKRLALSVVVSACLLTPAFAQEKSARTAPPDDKAKQEMQDYAAASQPGPMHRKLEAMVGEWDVAMTVWIPGAQEMTIKGTCVKSMVFGGRFLKEELKTPNPVTQKMGDSVGYVGYDNATKMYQGVYLSDDMTGMIKYEGTLSDDGKTFTFAGTEADPTGKNPTMKFKVVTTVDSPDQHTMTYAYVMPDGSEVKAFKIVHTRKK